MSRRDDATDEHLLARFQAGDAAAFETLFERHENFLRSTARARISPAVQAKVSVSDVVQETRITAHRGLQRFTARDPGALRVWLVRVVERKSLDAVRRYGGTAKRAVAREAGVGNAHRGAETAPGLSAVPAQGPSPSEAAMRSELAEVALRALAGLSPDHQEVLRHTRLKGLTLEQTAACMGRSPDAVKKLAARALAAFAGALRARDGADHGP